MTQDLDAEGDSRVTSFGEDAETYWRDALVVCDSCGYQSQYRFGTVVGLGMMPDEEIFSTQWLEGQVEESLRENGWSVRDDSASDYCPQCVDAKIAR